MPMLQRVPVVGFAVRAAIMEIPLLGQSVLGGMVGWALTRHSVGNGQNCFQDSSVWCHPPPSAQTMALWSSYGALPYTGALSLFVAYRSPEDYAQLAPAVLLATSLLHFLTFTPAGAATGAAMLGASDQWLDAAATAAAGGLAVSFVVASAALIGCAVGRLGSFSLLGAARQSFRHVFCGDRTSGDASGQELGRLGAGTRQRRTAAALALPLAPNTLAGP